MYALYIRTRRESAHAQDAQLAPGDRGVAFFLPPSLGRGATFLLLLLLLEASGDDELQGPRGLLLRWETVIGSGLSRYTGCGGCEARTLVLSLLWDHFFGSEYSVIENYDLNELEIK